MRLMFTLAVILSAAFCTSLTDRPPPEPQHQPNPRPPSPPILSWADYKLRYAKTYASLAEEQYRSHVFARGMRRMAEHNADPDRSFDMQPNSFLDVDSHEFQEVYTRAYPSGEHSWNVSREFIRRNARKNKGRPQHTPQYGE